MVASLLEAPMASWSGGSGTTLTPAEQERLSTLRTADSLADLVGITGATTEHEAYFTAKAQWETLRAKELAAEPVVQGIPGNRVEVNDRVFWVHGITHADTDAEEQFLREHVSTLVGTGASIYCEQGVRHMYFRDFPEVCEMDDYRWAVRECERQNIDATLSNISAEEFDGFSEDIDSVATEFRDAVFSLIDSGSEIYGEEFASALGDVASTFLVSHETMATGEDFTSFSLSRSAAEDPTRLRDLQQYYERRFLPQPVEREWLRRHDPELELVTHARNERMAAYSVYHANESGPVHLIVGAAHQPGVTYYLERIRAGDPIVEEFELVE